MPSLSNYYTYLPYTLSDPSYQVQWMFSSLSTEDLNGDGNQDILVLGASYPASMVSGGSNSPQTQDGRVLFGDGNGGFTSVSEAIFPVSTLQTVHPRKVIFEDLNNDGIPDIFISNHGWDTDPFPGEQNRLYLSQGSKWIDATSALPQLSDYSHTSAIADIDNNGYNDIFVGNGYGGQNQITPYMLMNNGDGTFSKTTANLPVSSGSIFDFNTYHNFNGATFSDIDSDGYVDLIITADHAHSSSGNDRSMILWNDHGTFRQNNITYLDTTDAFTYHIDLDAQTADVNNDGLLDVILGGTNGQPFYDGRFLQIFINHGNHVFIDETAQRIAPTDMAEGQSGVNTETPWVTWIKIIDFNRDGFTDFAVEYGGSAISSEDPLVYLNDGTGHFATLKVGDFITSGDEWRIYMNHFVETDRGYSLFSAQSNADGLYITGLLAQEYLPVTFPDLEYFHDSLIRGTSGNDTFVGTPGNDTITYESATKGVKINLSLTSSQKTGGSGIDTISGFNNLIGSDYNDILNGNEQNNRIDGGNGADKMIGGTGDDTYYIDNSGDKVTEMASAGTDIIYTSISITKAINNVESFIADGSADINILGNSLDNILSGNDGNNLLDGGLGNDTLSGGDGSDTFKVSTALGNTNIDTITDFTVGDDTIQLSKKIFKSISKGFTVDNFVNGSATGDANDYIIFDQTTGKLYYDADGIGTKSAAIQIAVIGNSVELGFSDFSVV